MGIAAIDPETGKWRTIYKGLSIGPGRVSPDGRYLVYSSLGVELPAGLDRHLGLRHDGPEDPPAADLRTRGGNPAGSTTGGRS